MHAGRRSDGVRWGQMGCLQSGRAWNHMGNGRTSVYEYDNLTPFLAETKKPGPYLGTYLLGTGEVSIAYRCH